MLPMAALLTLLLAFTGTADATTGAFERAWGKDVVSGGGTGFEVCTTASSCKAGVNGTLGGEFGQSTPTNGPFGVATDSAGNVYVTDGINRRVEKFDSNGNFLRAWGKDVIKTGGTGDTGTGFEICTVAADCQAGTSGTLGGELSGASGIAVDASGHVYVSDQPSNRIQEYDSNGNWIKAFGLNVNGGGVYGICTSAPSCQAGTAGGGKGAVFNPTGLATDSAGDLFVADFSNSRIEEFDPSANFLRAWGKDVIVGGSSGFEVCTATDTCQQGTSGGEAGALNSATGVATDATGNVYVADQINHRVQKFDSHGNFLTTWGKDVDATAAGTGFEICTAASGDTCKTGDWSGTQPGGDLYGPAGIAVDGSGSVYVADSHNQRLQKFDLNGNFELTWGRNVDATGGSGSGEICSVAANCQAGSSTTAFGGEFFNPVGVAADPAGAVYVADQFNVRIQKFVADPAPPQTGSTPPPDSTPAPVPAPTVTSVKKCKKGQKLKKGRCVKKHRR
jgi:tripartite motif-containing protein 71